MKRAILIGDGQLELFRSYNAMEGYVEPWFVEENICKIFSESGKMMKLTKNQGAYVNLFFGFIQRWMNNFEFTSVIQTDIEYDVDILVESVNEFMIRSEVQCEKLSSRSLVDIFDYVERHFGFSA